MLLQGTSNEYSQNVFAEKQDINIFGLENWSRVIAKNYTLYRSHSRKTIKVLCYHQSNFINIFYIKKTLKSKVVKKTSNFFFLGGIFSFTFINMPFLIMLF